MRCMGHMAVIGWLSATRRQGSSGYKLQPMTTQRACILIAVSATALSACSEDKPRSPDSAAILPPVVSAPVKPVPSTGWEAETAGPVMLLSISDNSAAALVVLPQMTDSTIGSSPFLVDSLSGLPVELFSRDGLSGSTLLTVDSRQSPHEGCLSWPQARLSEIPADPWRMGFVQGVVAPLPLDSTESMGKGDSTFVTRELARLSSLVAEGDDSTFRGLPFAVRKAYRFSHKDISVLVGDVIRKIPEEANPREEHLLVLAERAVSSSGSYSPVFHTRVAGAEDAVRTNDILGAVRFVKTGRPALVVAFEYEDGGRVALLQRMNEREWRITWRSAYTGC
jgi:hypothetical protein